MSLARRILFYLVIFFLVIVIAVWMVLHSDTFWRWAGGKIVAYAEEEVFVGELKVGKIEGNPFHGLFFHDIVLTNPEGKVLQACSLEFQISFWSILEFKPVIGKLELLKPQLFLWQNEQGEWNYTKILVPSEEPPQPQAPVDSIRFSEILITKGEVEVTQAGKTRHFKDLNLQLALNIDKPMTPEQDIQVGKLVTNVHSPYGEVSLTSRLSYKEDLLDIPLLDIKVDDQTVLSVAGKADLSEGGQVDMHGELDLPPERIHEFWERWPADWEGGAKFSVQGTASEMQLVLEGRLRDTALDVSGTLGQKDQTWVYDLKGTLKNLQPGMLAVYDKSLAPKVKELGPVTVEFHLQGTGLGFPPDQLSWNIKGETLRYGKVKLDRFDFSLTGDKEEQHLQGTARGNFGQVNLKASGALLSGKGGEFTLQADDFKPGPLALGAPEGTVLDAKVDGKFSAPGLEALGQAQVSGQIDASGKVGEYPLNKLEARLSYDQKELQVPQANVELGNLAVELQGSLVGERLDFTTRGKSAPGGNWPIPAAVGGQLSWEGTVKGTLSEPQISLQARGRNLTYEDFGVQSFIADIEGLGAPPSRGRVNVQATGVRTPAGFFSRATLQADGRDQRWNFDLRATGPRGVEVDVRGVSDLDRAAFVLDRAYFRLDKVTVRNLTPVEVSLSPAIVVEPATFQVNEGRVSLEARITDQQVTGNLTMQDLKAQWFTPESVPLQGTISGQVSLAGQPQAPIIEGTISLTSGSYQDVDFQSLKASFSYQDDILNTSGSLISKKQGPTLTWDGRVPMRLSLMPFNYSLAEGDMRILVEGENVNLSMLSDFTREVEAAQAPVTLQARIEGTPNNPVITGQASWGAGFIQLRKTGARYEIQPGEIRLQGDRVTVPQLTLRSVGTAILTADVSLKDYQPADLRARLQFNNFKAIDERGSEAFVNGTVTLDGNYPNLAVNGDLTIPKATFRLSFFNLGTTAVHEDVILVREQKAKKAKGKEDEIKLDEPQVWKNLQVNVRVRAPNNIRVDDRVAKIEASLDITVRKERAGELVYSGEVRTIEGYVFIVGREFNVVKGIVDLPAKPGEDPFVIGRITYEMPDGVILYAEASGPVTDYKITLGGEPPISDTDWMAYLLFGKPTGALSQQEYSAVASETFGGFATRVILKDFLGMTEPFPKGFSVTFQHRTDPLYRNEPYQVVIQYRINRRFTVQSQVGGRNTGGDVLYERDF
ncbi:MAG: translocation/assembly module TamB domain-containing protein [Desulfobacteraceae bacterium]